MDAFFYAYDGDGHAGPKALGYTTVQACSFDPPTAPPSACIALWDRG